MSWAFIVKGMLADLMNGVVFLWCFSSLQTTESPLQPLSHSYTDAYKVPTAHQFWVQHLAQGHFGMQLREPEIGTSDPLITR